MIDYKNKKFAYTTGNMFTLTGVNYVGYFNVLSGNAYISFDQKNKLDNVSNYKNDVVTGTYLFDRDLSEIPVLPYRLQDILINPEEFVTSQLLNERFKNLNNNNIYLYSRSFISDGNSPSLTTAAICLTSNTDTLNYYTNLDDLSTYDFNSNFLTNPYNIQNVVDVEAVLNAQENGFVIISPTSTQLILLTGGFTKGTFGIGLSTTLITDFTNDTYRYKNITGITVNKNNLFVADAGNNSIYKYSIEGFVANDPGFATKRFLLETIGTSEFKYGIKNPTIITSSDDSVFVYNKDSKYVVELDNDFNVRRTSKLVSSREVILSMGFSRFYNTLVVLAQSTTGKKMYFYQDFILQRTENILFELAPNEVVKKIVFSKNDSNIFYILTNSFIYKKYFSKPGKTICVFSDSLMKINNNNSQSNFTGVSIPQSKNNYDLFFIGKQDRILISQELNDFNTVLRDENVPNYDISSIYLDKDEYVQANYINKEIFKITSNLFKLKNQYLGRFNIEYSNPNNNLTYEQSILGENYKYKGYTYLDDYDFLKIENINNLYVHENEKVSAGVINRCFTLLYNLQEKMLEQSVQKNNTLVQYVTTFGTLIIS